MKRLARLASVLVRPAGAGAANSVAPLRERSRRALAGGGGASSVAPAAALASRPPGAGAATLGGAITQRSRHAAGASNREARSPVTR
jgi:hypothetical protein